MTWCIQQESVLNNILNITPVCPAASSKLVQILSITAQGPAVRRLLEVPGRQEHWHEQQFRPLRHCKIPRPRMTGHQPAPLLRVWWNSQMRSYWWKLCKHHLVNLLLVASVCNGVVRLIADPSLRFLPPVPSTLPLSSQLSGFSWSRPPSWVDPVCYQPLQVHPASLAVLNGIAKVSTQPPQRWRWCFQCAQQSTMTPPFWLA